MHGYSKSNRTENLFISLHVFKNENVRMKVLQYQYTAKYTLLVKKYN